MQYSKVSEDDKLKMLDYFFLFALGVLSCVLTFYYNSSTTLNSDVVSYILWGKDLAEGNLFLSGWDLPTNSFYLLSVFYALMGSLFGFSSLLSYLATALIYSAILVLIGVVVGKTFCSKYRIFLFVGIFLIAGIPVHSDYGLLGGAHLDIVFVTLIAFDLYSKFVCCEVEPKSSLLAVSLLILTLWSISDRLILLLGLLPLCIHFVFFYLPKRYALTPKRCIIKTAVVVFALIMAAVLPTIFNLISGSTTHGFPLPTLISVQEILPRGILLFATFGDMFDVNFWVYPINLASIISGLNFALFTCAIYVGIIESRKSHYLSCLVAVLLISAAFCFIVVWFSTYESLISLYSRRLLWIPYFEVLIIIALALGSLLKQKKSVCIKFLITFAALLLTISFMSKVSKISPKIETSYTILQAELDRRKLKDGFAPYWYSHSVTVASDFRRVIYPISGKVPTRFRWISKSWPTDLDARYIFLPSNSVEGSEHFDLTEDGLINFLGSADEIVPIEIGMLYVWRKNLAPLLFRGLVEAKEFSLLGSLFSGTSGSVIKGGDRVLEEGSTLFGPYCDAASGNYIAVYRGDNMLNVRVDAHSESLLKSKNILLKSVVLSKSPSIIVMAFSVPESISDLEVRLTNLGATPVTVHRIEVNNAVSN